MIKNKDKVYKNKYVLLKEKYRTDEETSFDGIPTVYYEILQTDGNTKVGTIELRLSIKDDMYYYGHVGYNIIRKYRGNHYAYYACKLLFTIANKEFEMKELLITCSPDNVASYKTLKKLHFSTIDLIEVPKGHTLYKLGERNKFVFKYNID